ncbi:unnamed protein product [Moneuplotes crassus]|uniref:Uncharacterized protein n=1 Tax=Euplotes crassus TaxID=5936 RepID=A0AAD1XFI7_EUPCR|nr:unnamed protein product [Moneuplotes crassus]
MSKGVREKYFDKKSPCNPKIRLPRVKKEKLLNKNVKIQKIHDDFERHLNQREIGLFGMDKKLFKEILEKIGYPMSLTKAIEGYLKVEDLEKQGNLHIALQTLAKWVYQNCKSLNPDVKSKSRSIRSFSTVNRSLASIHKLRERKSTQDSLDYCEMEYRQGTNRVSKVNTELKLPDLKRLRSRVNKLLPDPKHPWRDPLKNTPFKWYEMIDVSSDSEGEGDQDDKCSFLRKLTVNRRKRREETEKKMRELKMTPEYGMNAAKIRLKEKKRKEDSMLRSSGVDKLTSCLTSELSNSIGAYNLKILLKRKWYEDKKNYKIMGTLSKKEERRLSKVIPLHRFT